MISSASVCSRLKGLYAITDPVLLPGARLLSGVESALRGGTRIIQYRDKNASSVQRIRDAESLRSLTRSHEAVFLINDDVELCQRVKADGVHLGRQDGDIGAARARLGPDLIIGVTCHHDIDYARQAVQAGVDYCAFGRLFPSQTKPDAPHCPLEILSEAAKLPCPTVAIGGITKENTSVLAGYGVDMIAVIHGLFGQVDIEATARLISQSFTRF